MSNGNMQSSAHTPQPITPAEIKDMVRYRIQHGKILEVKKLPTLPDIAYRLLDLLSQDDPDLSELEEIIRYDQAITAKVLSVANSAFFGVQKEIDTLHRAIITLGVREVGEIAFSICVVSVFRPVKSINGFDVREFWLHSIGTGITARIIAQALDCAEEERFFTLGLLHDIGRLILLFIFPREFEEILENREKSGKSLLFEEKEYGLAHTWVGRWLLRRWGLPEVFAQVARFHHHPFYKGKFLFEPAVVKLADIVAHKMAIGNLPVGPQENEEPLLKKLGLSEDLYQAILDHLSLIREGMKEAWGHLF